jgi:SNF family Na+-dependent transporter
MLGQLLRKGPVEVFQMIGKKFTGLGWATVFVSFALSAYYAIILCWAVYYFFLSFSSPLPWSREATSGFNASDIIDKEEYEANFMNVDFFEKDILKKSGGIEEIGSVDGNLALCLIVTYILIYICIAKGIQSSSKVVYFTAPAPIVLLIILLIK